MEKNHSRPSSEDAARRLLILRHVAASVVIAPVLEISGQWSAEEREKFQRSSEAQYRQFWQGLRDVGLWPHLSPLEKAHAACTIMTMTEQQVINATWRIEAAQMLAWALGMLPQLPPYDARVSFDFLEQVPTDGLNAFIGSARLREESEIDAARETAEFWHWRSRTRELIERGEPFPDEEDLKTAGLRCYDDVVRISASNGVQEGLIPKCIDEDFPAKGKAYRDLSEEEWSEVTSITVERHFALNWLCGYAPGNRWDETPTDT